MLKKSVKNFVVIEREKFPTYKKHTFPEPKKHTLSEEPERELGSSNRWRKWLLYAWDIIETVLFYAVLAIGNLIGIIYELCITAYNFFNGNDPIMNMRNELLEKNRAIYTTELPNAYWENIQPYIIEGISSKEI